MLSKKCASLAPYLFFSSQEEKTREGGLHNHDSTVTARIKRQGEPAL